jgi:flavin-binding protein dodecin
MTPEAEHARGPAVVRVIELVGVSEESWTDAASRAIARAAQTIRHITGADILHQTAMIRDGKIVEYHVNLKVAFIVEEALDLGREMGSLADTYSTA